MVIYFRAPNGCLQYFTGIRNTVTSFNFDGTSAHATGGNLMTQDYNVCFRTEQGKKSSDDQIIVLTAQQKIQLHVANNIFLLNCRYVQYRIFAVHISNWRLISIEWGGRRHSGN